MAYKVFISSTQKDLDLARDLARRLELAGVKVFSVDRAAVPAERIISDINRGMREADEVVVILTDDSVKSPGVISELGAAYSLHKRVTPLLVGVEDATIPPFLKRMSYIKYDDLHDYISRLQKRTAALEPNPA